jgi:hypothetical protein
MRHDSFRADLESPLRTFCLERETGFEAPSTNDSVHFAFRLS